MEQEILQMLQQSPGTLFSAKEVAKRIDRAHYKTNPNWARPLLQHLLTQKFIAADQNGYYFYPKARKLGEII